MDDVQARLEWIEGAAIADFHRAASADARAALGLRCEEIGGAFVSMATRDPSILLNRVVGLGVHAPASAAGVAAITEAYKNGGIGRYFLRVHAEAEPPSLRQWLDDCGLVAYRRWMTFQRGRTAPPDARTDLRIAEIGPEYGEAFGRIVAPAFDLTDAAVAALACLPGRPDWRVFMCFDGDTPAGCGALYAKDGAAWCDWGATAPAFRRRGAQRAVLAARVQAALNLGCDLIATETGEAVEGDPQHSYHNILWAGFQEAGLRDNYVPRD